MEEIEKPKEEDEEIDFDFSIYDAEEQETEVVESLANLSKARITGLRSRYSNWARELERLANLEDDITKVSIEVASFVQDISTLWNFYGMLHAYWERIRTIFGTVISDDVIAKGVLRAVLHKQIRVPEQMRLITYANKGIELPFHKPVTRYECDMEKTASLATEAMIELLNGHECEQNIHFPGELIKGQTT